jgi:hypothetical protein
MDTYLHYAWQLSRAPFAHETLHCIDELPLYELSRLLALLVSSLKEQYGAIPLLHVVDWHEHDGYITQNQTVDWAFLHALVLSPEALFTKVPRDEYVRLGFYDPQGTFYLRLFVADGQESLIASCGEFDLSGSRTLIQSTQTLLACDSLQVSNAKQYFDARYGG